MAELSNPLITLQPRRRQRSSNRGNINLDIYIQLNNGIRALEHVNHDLDVHGERLSVLHAQLETASEELKRQKERTTECLNEVREMRRLSLKRVRHTISGDINRSLAKSEHSYLEEKAREDDGVHIVQSLREQVDNENEKIECLNSDKQRLTMLRAELREFVENAFNGPNPDYPEVDAKKTELVVLARKYDVLRQKLIHDDTVKSHLQSSHQLLAFAREQVRSTARETFASGTVYSSDSLQLARQKVTEAQYQLRQARELDPSVPDLLPSSLLSDNNIFPMMFNLFSRNSISFSRINRIRIDITTAIKGLHVAMCTQRHQASLRYRQAHALSKLLAMKQQELTVLRLQALEQAVQNCEQPPPYSEI